MDMNKILQWMDLAKKYQTTDFWDGIFEQSSFDEFMKNNVDGNHSGETAMKTGHGKKSLQQIFSLQRKKFYS